MWDYLDKMNHNLLYKYAAVLSGKKRHFYNTDSEKDASVNAEEKKKNVCYLIWFVYRYILQCRTLEETLPYQNEEILRKYKLFLYAMMKFVFVNRKILLLFWKFFMADIRCGNSLTVLSAIRQVSDRNAV